MRRLQLAAVVAGLLLSACRPHTVELSFRPRVGTVLRYEVRVHSVVETRYEGAAPRRVEESVRLVAEHHVLRRGRDGVEVQVILAQEGVPSQAFVVRFDRAGQLRSVEAAAGAPGTAVGSLGVSEIFPAALGAPAGRRLEPGERWRLDESVQVPGAARPARLRGEGRLTRLGVAAGEDVAHLAVSSVLPLLVRTHDAEGRVVLDGRQHLTQAAVYDLDDGALRRAEARTTGRFRLTLTPATGLGGPIHGELDLDVASSTRRLD